MKEMLGGCCVCADENGWTDNPLIYCDGPNCEVAVHQGCYGIQEVPEGEWLCAKCNASSSTTTTTTTTSFNPPTNGVMKNGGGMRHQFRCGLCPSTFGALKRTDKNGWAHVICALYIPEVRFGDVHSMEPVILSDVPNDRYDKVCYICENLGEHANAKMGACMSCNKIGCKRGFHVTCAQQKGLLCEEGGISKNVKYCGYCENHLRKAQHDPLIKVIPACPVTRGLPPATATTDQPTPPPSTNSAAHMLVDPLPRSAAELVLGIGSSSLKSESVLLPTAVTPQQNHHHQSSIFGSNTTTFSPPLTTSSRSSVALDTTPPLHNNGTSTMTSHHLIAGASSETSVGAHLQQIQQAQNAAAAAQLAAISSATAESLNGSSIYSSVNHVNSYFANDLAGRIPANFLPNGDFHLNGTNDLEEKTVKAVLTAPLTKAKRNRPDMIEKVSKRARMNARPNNSNAMNSSSSTNSSQSSTATVGKSPSMQRLISLVAPVVSETVSDFQRDRIADRTAAERRAAAAMSAPSTSANGTTATTINGAAELIGAATGSNGITSNGTTSSTTTVSKISQHSTLPSSMEQLLERQWEQGSQLLMSQAHFDVAQLLTCLHQLKTENVRLDEQLGQLTKRLGHLTALNTRLSQPLGPPSGSSQHQQQQQLTSPLTSPHHQEPPPALPQPTPQHQQPIINRPLATHAPVVAAAVSTSAQQRVTPSTAGHALSAATPNNLTAVTPTTNNTAQPVSSASLAELAASLSPERLAQLSSASSALHSMYRNPIIDPALLTQLVMNQNYLTNSAAVSNSTLSSNVLSRIFQQQPQFAAALVNANSLPAPQQPPTPAATK